MNPNYNNNNLWNQPKPIWDSGWVPMDQIKQVSRPKAGFLTYKTDYSSEDAQEFVQSHFPHLIPSRPKKQNSYADLIPGLGGRPWWREYGGKPPEQSFLVDRLGVIN